MIVTAIALDKVVVTRERFRVPDTKKLKEYVDSMGNPLFGQLQPIIVEPSEEEGVWNLVDGLHRLMAARLLKWEEIAATTRDQLTELQAREIELETNIRRTDMTWMEKAKALVELDRLKKAQDPNWGQANTAAIAGVDQADVGRAAQVVKMATLFPELADSKTLNQALMRAKDKAKQVLRVKDVSDQPDTYRAVEDRIWLGDSVDLIKSVPDESIKLILTDPPFGINYDERRADTAGSVSAYEDSAESYVRLLSMADDLYRVTAQDGFLIWFLGISWYERAKQVFRGAGFTVDEIPVIWDRSDGRCFTSRPDRWFGRSYDIALHCVKGNPQLAQRGKPNILRVPPVGVETRDLLVERPIELYAELIRRCTIEGETVADFFVGSGSCPAAAVSLRRQYFGVEIDAERRAVAIQKIKAHTP